MPSTPRRPLPLHAQSLLFSEPVVLRGGAVFLESPQLRSQSSLLYACPRQGPGGGPASSWRRRCCLVPAGPRAPPPNPTRSPGRTDLERGPWRRGPLSPRKAGCLVGREDCVPHNPPRGALPQAVALVPVVPPSPLRPWPTGWSARVRTSPGSHTPARHLSPQLSSETASPCTHTGGTGSGRSPDALRELNVFLCNF